MGWSLVFYGLMALFMGLALYHRFILPRPSEDSERAQVSASHLLRSFGETFLSFFKKEQALTTICFLLLFRFARSFDNPYFSTLPAGIEGKRGDWPFLR